MRHGHGNGYTLKHIMFGIVSLFRFVIFFFTSRQFNGIVVLSICIDAIMNQHRDGGRNSSMVGSSTD